MMARVPEVIPEVPARVRMVKLLMYQVRQIAVRLPRRAVVRRPVHHTVSGVPEVKTPSRT